MSLRNVQAIGALVCRDDFHHAKSCFGDVLRDVFWDNCGEAVGNTVEDIFGDVFGVFFVPESIAKFSSGKVWIGLHQKVGNTEVVREVYFRSSGWKIARK